MKTIKDLFGHETVISSPEEIIEELRSQNMTYHQIAAYLNRHDVKNSRNVEWTAQAVKRRDRRARGLKG